MNSLFLSYRWISLGLRNEFGSAIVNEPSAFELSEVYCIILIAKKKKKKKKKMKEKKNTNG